MRAVYRAFDEAWAAIAPAVGTDPQGIEDARLELAETVLAVTWHDSTDVNQIKSLALQVMRSAWGGAQRMRVVSWEFHRARLTSVESDEEGRVAFTAAIVPSRGARRLGGICYAPTAFMKLQQNDRERSPLTFKRVRHLQEVAASGYHRDALRRHLRNAGSRGAAIWNTMTVL